MRILMLGLDAAGKTSILSLVMKTTTTVLVELWSMFTLCLIQLCGEKNQSISNRM